MDERMRCAFVPLNFGVTSPFDWVALCTSTHFWGSLLFFFCFFLFFFCHSLHTQIDGLTVAFVRFCERIVVVRSCCCSSEPATILQSTMSRLGRVARPAALPNARTAARSLHWRVLSLCVWLSLWLSHGAGGVTESARVFKSLEEKLLSQTRQGEKDEVQATLAEGVDPITLSVALHEAISSGHCVESEDSRACLLYTSPSPRDRG